MNSDFRIETACPTHRKTRRLTRGDPPHHGWSLVCLWAWAALHQPDGDLTEMSDREIELAAEWTGTPGDWIARAVEVEYVDGPQNGRRIHDWIDHQPWASGAEIRSRAGRIAAQARWSKNNNKQHQLTQPNKNVNAGRNTDRMRSAYAPSLPTNQPTNQKPRARGTGGAAPETPGSPSGRTTENGQTAIPNRPPWECHLDDPDVPLGYARYYGGTVVPISPETEARLIADYQKRHPSEIEQDFPELPQTQEAGS